jgi:uncharacterized protein YndB with AHSA1/START domain
VNAGVHFLKRDTMIKKVTAQKSIVIAAPKEKVWEALTTPEQIRQYLFGTETITDWKKGSPIVYKGVWEGRSYEEKGMIIDIVPGKLLHTTYLGSGKEDKPENYANVIYTLDEKDGSTTVNISQDNIGSEEERQHSEKNWGMVLEGMKKMLEKTT